MLRGVAVVPKVHRLSRLLCWWSRWDVIMNVNVNVNVGVRDAEVGTGQSAPVQLRGRWELRGHLRSFTIAPSTLPSIHPLHHVEPSRRRLGGCRSVALPAHDWKGQPVHHWLCAALCLYASKCSAPCAAVLTNAPALLLTGFFGLSMSSPSPRHASTRPSAHQHARSRSTDRSFINLPLVGAPASIAFGYAPSAHTCTTSSH